MFHHIIIIYHLIKYTCSVFIIGLIKTKQFSMFYEMIDNDDYSKNKLYSLNIFESRTVSSVYRYSFSSPALHPPLS